MKMMRIAGALILIVALSGCGAGFRHPTATQETYNKDSYECLKEAAGLTGSSTSVTAYRSGSTAVVHGRSSRAPSCGMVVACLVAKGYRRPTRWQKRQFTLNTEVSCRY